MENLKNSCAFSLRRFGLLARKHYTDNGRRYLANILIIWGVLIFNYWMESRYGTGPGSTSLLFPVLWGGASLLWVRYSLSIYYQPKTAVGAFTLPASPFEKYLFAWLNSILGGTVVVWVLFFVTDMFSRLLHGPSFSVMLDLFGISGQVAYLFVWFVLTMQMLAFLCYIAFERYYILVLIALMVGFIILSVWAASLGVGLLGNYVVEQVAWVPIPRGVIFFFVNLFMPLAWAVMGVAGYFKLRERAVR